MDEATPLPLLRREWLARQSLRPVTAPRALVDAVGAIGWVPAPVGASMVLALRARGLIAHRAELDEAVLRKGELAVVPGPRGMAWLCPCADAALVRSFSVADHAAREARVASACALTAKDLTGARDALRAALDAPRTAEELRAKLPPAFTRPLGSVGQRAGAFTTAGLVLRGMWCVGEVVRAPASGRVDGDAFTYAIDPRPRVTPNAAEAVDLVAARWFNAHGPASARTFAAAFGIAAGRASAALKPLHLKAIHAEELDDHLLTPGGVEAAPWAEPEVVFLGLRDPLTDAMPSLSGLVAAPLAKSLMMRHLGPGPVVLVDGEVRGAWSVDAVGRVIVRPVGLVSPELFARMTAEGERVARFVAESFGGAPALHGTALPRLLPPLTAEIGGGL